MEEGRVRGRMKERAGLGSRLRLRAPVGQEQGEGVGSKGEGWAGFKASG